jgi:hypothetical protein
MRAVQRFTGVRGCRTMGGRVGRVSVPSLNASGSVVPCIMVFLRQPAHDYLDPVSVTPDFIGRVSILLPMAVYFSSHSA